MSNPFLNFVVFHGKPLNPMIEIWQRGGEMLSNIPFDMDRLKALGREQPDVELIRIGIIAELDAINLYEQLAAQAKDELVRRVFLDIAEEEKEHFGEFMELLKRYDKEVEDALESGREEVIDMDTE